MTAKLPIPKATTGKGYVGVFRNGPVGWFLPEHLCGHRTAEPPNPKISQYYSRAEEPDGHRTYLCRITIEPLTDKLGRPITRRVKE